MHLQVYYCCITDDSKSSSICGDGYGRLTTNDDCHALCDINGNPLTTFQQEEHQEEEEQDEYGDGELEEQDEIEDQDYETDEYEGKFFVT